MFFFLNCFKVQKPKLLQGSETSADHPQNVRCFSTTFNLISTNKTKILVNRKFFVLQQVLLEKPHLFGVFRGVLPVTLPYFLYIHIYIYI